VSAKYSGKKKYSNCSYKISVKALNFLLLVQIEVFIFFSKTGKIRSPFIFTSHLLQAMKTKFHPGLENTSDFAIKNLKMFIFKFLKARQQ